MYFYQSQSSDPYFNIATEEYFLKHFDADFFYLYINEPSIIVGKHQNTAAEINVPYVVANNLKVVRRLSGGGTVFHDFGNLNYCFIKRGAEGQLVDFKRYTQPVLNTLIKMGVPAKLRGKSDLVIGDKKFSGNAEHVFRNKILHHGTMLFHSKLDALNQAIKSDWNKFTDKAVRSNRSIVTNIVDHLEEKISLEDFAKAIENEVLNDEQQVQVYNLNQKDKLAIQQLVDEKYSQWEWNFGYSPTYTLNQVKAFGGGELGVNMEVNKGKIKHLAFTLNGQEFDEGLCSLLLDMPNDYFVLKDTLDGFLAEHNHLEFTSTDLLSLLF